MKGTVKFFNSKKGWGFIGPDEKDSKDVFVHYSEIGMEGYKTLRTGDIVEYEIKESDKGPMAAGVKVIGASSDEKKEKGKIQ